MGFLELQRGRNFQQRPEEFIDKDLQAQGPATEHLFVLRNVTDLVTREEQAPEPKVPQTPPCFPREASKRRQRKPTGRKQQAAARPKPWFPGTRSRQSKALLPRSIASEMAIPLEQKLPTGSQEKQSHVVEAAGGQYQEHRRKDPSLLLFRLYTNTNGRGKSRDRGRRERFGAKDNGDRHSSGARRTIWRAGP